MPSPENATAEQYDACRPSRSMVHVAPASRLMQRPIPDAANYTVNQTRDRVIHDAAEGVPGPGFSPDLR